MSGYVIQRVHPDSKATHQKLSSFCMSRSSMPPQPQPPSQMDPPPSSLRVNLEDDADDWELLLPSCIAQQPPHRTTTTTTTPPSLFTKRSRQPANSFETVPVVGLGGSIPPVSISQKYHLHHRYLNDGNLDDGSSLPGVVVMPGWKDDYLSALLEAERDNPVNLELVDACMGFLSFFRSRVASAH